MPISPSLRPATIAAELTPTAPPFSQNNPSWQQQRVEIPISYYWLLLRRYRSRILALVVVVTTLTALLALNTKKTYQATALVRVDPSGLRVVGDSQGQGAGADARLLVSTEANVITSPAVEQQAIDELHLGDIPEFQSKLPPNATDVVRADRLLRSVGAHISVSQPLDTYLLAIQFRAHNASLAATAANGLAHAFLEHEYATRAKALTDSTSYMSDQLDSLRAQMERDGTALVNYESSHDVINPDDKENIYQARLSQINSELTQAESARIGLQADAQIAAAGDVDALLASPRGQTLVPLRDRSLSDQRELSHLATIYGPAHPLYKQQQAVVQNDLQVLEQQEHHVASQIGAQFQVASANEQLLRTSLTTEKQAVDAFNLRAVHYHELKAAADSSTALYYDLQKQIQDATVAAGQRSENLRVISPAVPSDIPVSPRLVLWIGLAFLLSSLVGIGCAVTAGILDKSISSPDQVEQWFHVHVIGSLPKVGQRETALSLSPSRFLTDPAATGATPALTKTRHSPFHESILSIYSAVAFALEGDASGLAITSSVPGEGKSTVSANLAAAFAALGRRTVLIDADLRKPSVHRKFMLENRIGLSTLLRHRCSVGEALQTVSPRLSLLLAGPSVANPAELLHLHFEEVLEQLRDQFDFLLVDCPPVLGLADTGNIAGQIGRVLVVAKAGSTDRGNLNAALRQLAGAGANVLGVVLNCVSAELGQYYGYYHYHEYGDAMAEEGSNDE